MSAASSSARPPAPPRFAGHAVALLLPVALLAILATLALARDWRAARTEATARAQELAAAALDRSFSTLLPAVTPHPETPADSSAPGLGRWILGPSNALIEPPPQVWPPLPEPIDPGEVPTNNQKAWRAARDAFEAGRWSECLGLYDELLTNASSANASPGPPRLGPRLLGNALLEQATAFERLGRTNEAVQGLRRILADRSLANATTEAGLPVPHLAALRLLDLVDVRQISRWFDEPGLPAPFAALNARTPPSPFLRQALDRLHPVLDEATAHASSSATLRTLRSEFDRAEEERRLHAVASKHMASVSAWPALFWIDDPRGPSLAVSRGSPSASATEHADAGLEERHVYVLVPEQILRSNLFSVVRELDRRGEFTVRLSLAGRTLPGPSNDLARELAPTDPPLATATRAILGDAPLIVATWLTNPGTFYGSQWRRTLTFGGLLAAALGAAAVSVFATRRSLVRQHDLNLQKTNFVSSVSHELRAPLGSIRLLAEGLERGTVAEDSRRQEYFQLISQETRRLGALVENVLDFSRIEQGRKRYEFEPTDLRALVVGTLKVFQPLASARDVVLACELPPESVDCEILADGRALQQAQLNLLDNALKHSPANSRIRITLTAAPDRRPVPTEFRLSVSDQGPGIPAAEHTRIFEPFYRLGSELRRETQGVGIGLAIVRHIVQAHHGRIELDSAPGAGASFTLALPVTPPSSTKPARS